jgi:hypothetical protein
VKRWWASSRPLRGFSPSGFSDPAGREGRRRPSPTLMRLSFPSKRSPELVAAIRFTTPATPFSRPRGIPDHGRPAPERRQLPWSWTPLQGTPVLLRRLLSKPTDPPGVFRPFSDIDGEVHITRASGPVRSAFRVSHPPDGLLPLPSSDPGGSEPLVGFDPSEPFPLAEPYAFRRQIPSCRF